ncbi:MAG: hypothetical protein NVS3B14_15720 [Ktedonobacteraceae bacterium]
MAVAILYEIPGMAQEQYDKIIELLQRGNKTAQGRSFHVAGPTDSGWRVLDVFESQKAFETFVQENLAPIIQEVGATPPQIQVWPVHNILTGPDNFLAQVATSGSQESR